MDIAQFISTYSEDLVGCLGFMAYQSYVLWNINLYGLSNLDAKLFERKHFGKPVTYSLILLYIKFLYNCQLYLLGFLEKTLSNFIINCSNFILRCYFDSSCKEINISNLSIFVDFL